MTQIFTGEGLGSHNALSTREGHSTEVNGLGQTGNNIQVNVANGNMVLRQEDGFLADQGFGLHLFQTYNSQGKGNWIFNMHTSLSFQGLLNQTGSCIQRLDEEGHISQFFFDATKGYYLTEDNPLARLRYVNDSWEYTEGDSSISSQYDAQGQLQSLQDADGHCFTFQYENGQLIRIVDTSGKQQATWHFEAGRLMRVSMESEGKIIHQIQYAYDALGRVKNFSRGVGQALLQVHYEYDGDSNRIACLRQSNGMYCFFKYEDDKLVTMQEGEKGITRYSYETGKTRVTLPSGQVVVYHYDEKARLTEIESPGMHTLQYRYDNNRLCAIIQGTRQWRFYYNAAGDCERTVEPSGRIISRVFDDHHRLLKEEYICPFDGETKPANTETHRYLYDAKGHLRFSIKPNGIVQEYRYDNQGLIREKRIWSAQFLAVNAEPTLQVLENWVSLQNPAAVNLESYEYDWRGQCTKTTQYLAVNHQGEGLVDNALLTFTEYDAAGLLIAKSSFAETGLVTTYYVYDALGRLEKVVDPGGKIKQLEYDDTCHRIVETDAAGLQTITQMDANGLVISVHTLGKAEDFGSTLYTRDAQGNIICETDPLGQKQWNFYKETGQLQGTITSSGQLKLFYYDGYGNVIKIRICSQLIDVSAWDTIAPSLDTLIPDNHVDDRITHQIYDSYGFLKAVIDGEGAIILYRRNAAGQILEKRALAQTLSSVDTVRLASDDWMPDRQAGDRIIHYYYDAANQLQAMVDGEGYATAYIYNATGQVIETIRYFKSVSQYSGNWQTDAPASAKADIHQYILYNAAGLKVGEIDGEGYLIEYRYDGRGLLIETRHSYNRVLNQEKPLVLETLRPAPDDRDQYTIYRYDAAGLCIQIKQSNGLITSFTYDDMGRVITINREDSQRGDRRVEHKRYDAAGRLIAELDATGARLLHSQKLDALMVENIWKKHGTHFSYDKANQLISKTNAQGETTLYFYNESGLPVYCIAADGGVTETSYNAFQEIAFTRQYSVPVNNPQADFTLQSLQQYLATIRNDQTDKITSYTYNHEGLLESVSNKNQHNKLLSYNAFGEIEKNLEALDDHRQIETHYQYDRRGLLIDLVKDPRHTALHFTNKYDAFGRLQTQSDARMQATNYHYDKCGRTLYITRDRAYRSLSWDAFGRILKESDWSGSRSITWQYQHNTFTRTAHDGQCLSITHTNAFGDTVEVQDAAGRTTRYFFNEKGENTTIEGAEGYKKNYRYDAVGRLIWQEEAEGQTIAYSLDAMGRILSETRDPEGLALEKRYTFDALGRQLTMQDPGGLIQRFTYNDQGFLESVCTDPDGLQLLTTFTYDRAGHLLRKTLHNPTGKDRITAYTWDELGRCVSTVEDPDNEALTTHYTYDAMDNLVKMTNPAGNETHYIYDNKNQRIFQIEATGQVTESRYDVNGNNTHTIKYAKNLTDSIPDTDNNLLALLQADSNDQWQINVFDDHNRLALSFDAEGYATSYTYDLVGNLHKTIRYAKPVPMKDLQAGRFSIPSAEEARQTFYFYNDLNKLRFTVDGMGYVKEHQWNKAGLCIKTIAYANRLSHFPATSNTKIFQESLISHNAKDQIILYAYDKVGRLCFQRSAEGAVTAWKYDAADRVIKTIIHAQRMDNSSDDFSTLVTGTSDRITQTVYDPAGRLIYKISPEKSVREYSYDQAGNVICETAYGVKFSLEKSDAYTLRNFFETLPNQTDKRATQYQYDASGKIIAARDAAGQDILYTYDPSGNIIEKTDASGALWHYTYDKANRLIETQAPAATVFRKNAQGDYQAIHQAIVTRQVYDSFGNVITRIEDALGENIQTHFKYDKKNNLSEIHYAAVGVHNAAATYSADRQETWQVLVEKKVWNAFGEVAALQDKAGNWSYFIHDLAGRQRFSLNATGALTQQQYDAFGNCVMTIAHALPVQAFPGHTSYLHFTKAVLYSAQDRQSFMEYDKDNRLISTKREAQRSYNADTRQYNHTINPETRITYDIFGQVKTKSIRLNEKDWAVSQFYYNQDGQLDIEINALGYMTRREWNALGECVAETQYAKALTKDQLITNPVISSEDRQFTYQYDSLGRQIRKTQLQVQYQQLQGNTIISVTEDLHTLYTWDAMGNMTSLQDAAGYKIYMYYDALGQLTAKIGPANAQQIHSAMTYGYDAQGRLVQTHQWEQGTTTPTESGYILNNSHKDIITHNFYDTAGQLVSKKDGLNHHLNFSYDANGQLAREWDVLHQWGDNVLRDKRHLYDAAGRLLESKTFKNTADYFTEDFSYNIFGELQAKGFNKQFQTYWDYDQLGRVWRSNTQGHYELYLYNLGDHLTQIIIASNADDREESIDLSQFPLDKVLQFDESGWSKTLQKQDKQRDALGQLIGQRTWIEDETFSLQAAHQYWQYDRFGNMISHHNTQGYETRYIWNALNVLTKKILPEVAMENEKGQLLRICPEQYFACDVLGRTIALQDANGNISYKRYDGLGQLIEEREAGGAVTSKRYDALGQLTSTTAPGEVLIQYTYDKANRLIAVGRAGRTQHFILDEAGHMLQSKQQEETIRYWYDNNGNMIKKQDTRLHDTYYRFDDEGHKIEERDALNNTQQWVYERGLLKSYTDLGGHTTRYSHNKNGLLTEETSTRGRHIQYRYTQDGKLRQFEDKAHRETVNFTHDSENRIKTREGGRVAGGIDGWLREREIYTYDALGRLVTVQKNQMDEENPDSLTAWYTYDAASNIRHTKVVTQKKNYQTAITDEYYLYDANNRMVVNKGSLVNGKIDITATQGTALTYDIAGNIKAARSYESGTETAWKYWYNQHNQIELIEKNGKRIQTKQYDAVGRIQQETIFNANNQVDKVHVMHVNQGLVRAITTHNDKGEELNRESLEYDAMDNRTQSNLRIHARDDAAGATITHVYSYDARFSTYEQNRDEVFFAMDKGTTTTGLSTRIYDVNGQLQEVIDQQSDRRGQHNHTHYWNSSLDGMRAKQDKTGKTTYINLGGKTIADVHHAPDGKAQMNVYAGFTPVGSKDNDISEQPQTILPEIPQTITGEYILQINDSLEQIALQVYGDSSLWYIIADANGLASKDDKVGKSEALRPGQRLTIPPVAVGQHHKNDTHKVLNKYQMVGDISPTVAMPDLILPKAKKHSLFAKIVVAVISMVATVLTAGILGALSGASVSTLGELIGTGFKLLGAGSGGGLLGSSIGFAAGFTGSLAGQGLAKVLGMQKGVDLKNSLINGLATALGTIRLPEVQALENVKKVLSDSYFNGLTAAQMMQNNAMNQGLNMAFHRQSRFNWPELIATGAAGGVLGGEKIQGINNYLRDNHGPAGKLVTKQIQSFATEGAQSLINGGKFSPSQVLKNTVGQTLADTLLESSISQNTKPTNQQKRDDLYLTDTVLDIIHPERTSEEIYKLSQKQQGTMRKKAAYKESGIQKNTVIEQENIPVNNSKEIWLIDTGLAGKTSMLNSVLKLGYEGYSKQKAVNILRNANTLHHQKMKKIATAPDLKKAQQLFKTPTAKTALALQNAQNFPYRTMSKFGAGLNALYIGGEGYNAYVTSKKGMKTRNVTAAVGGAAVEVAGGIAAMHGAGLFFGGVAGLFGPIFAVGGYTVGAIAGTLIYNLTSLGSQVKNRSSEFIKSYTDNNGYQSACYKAYCSYPLII